MQEKGGVKMSKGAKEKEKNKYTQSSSPSSPSCSSCIGDGNGVGGGVGGVCTTTSSSSSSCCSSSMLLISNYEWWLTTIAFFFLGMSSLFAWNNILYLLPYVTEHFLSGYDAGNSLLGVYQVGNLLVQLLLMYLGSIKELWIHIGLFLGSIICSFFGPCIFYGSVHTRIVLVHILCFLLGSGSGFVQGSGFSYGALMPINQVGIYSAGQGFGAIFSVILVGILSYTVVDINITQDVKTLVNVTAGVSAAVGVVCIVLMAASIRQKGAKKAVMEAINASNNNNTNNNNLPGRSGSSPATELQEVSISSSVAATATAADQQQHQQDIQIKQTKHALITVLQQAGIPIACVFLLFFVTCNLFPRVGPLQWDTSSPPKNHLVWLLGVFPFGDTLGKCLIAYAEQGKFLKGFLMFSPTLLPWVTVLRFALYIPFFLSKKLHDNVVFNAFWFQIVQMVVLSVTHGWFATLAFIYSVAAVPSVANKKYVGPLAIVSLILGILSGLYFALLYK